MKHKKSKLIIAGSRVAAVAMEKFPKMEVYDGREVIRVKLASVRHAELRGIEKIPKQ